MANWSSSSLLNQPSFLCPSLLKTVTFWRHKWLFIYFPIKCMHGPKSCYITPCSIHKCSTHYYKLLDHLIFFVSSFVKKKKKFTVLLYKPKIQDNKTNSNNNDMFPWSFTTQETNASRVVLQGYTHCKLIHGWVRQLVTLRMLSLARKCSLAF